MFQYKSGGFYLSENVLIEAEKFIRSCYKELNKTEKEIEERLHQIQQQITEFGYYEHTKLELEYGAKLAWRNSNRCIGRLFWNQLEVIDKRHVETEEEVFEALCDHIKNATNNGRIKPLITVFLQKHLNKSIRIWNHQLFRYAGYETTEGIIGDPDSTELTNYCINQGWLPKYGRFDLLPLVIQINNNNPKLFDIPKELIYEVPIYHPDYSWFADLQLKWYAVPIISNMTLEIGGISYTAAPFNGWYMGTEIGARNFADEKRYNMLPQIGSLMGLDTNSNQSLWKDKALVELNIAVLSSYKSSGVTIVDHHTAANQFKKFEEKEMKIGRKVTGNWTWLIPPVSPATTHIFHKPYNNVTEKPNYFYQKRPF